MGQLPWTQRCQGWQRQGLSRVGAGGRGAGSGFLAQGAHGRQPRAARVPEAAKLKSD